MKKSIYSFLQRDSFMKSFFQSAFLGRKKQQPPIIINLDISPNIKNTYCKIFKNINDENFITGSFSERCNELMELIDTRIKETKK